MISWSHSASPMKSLGIKGSCSLVLMRIVKEWQNKLPTKENGILEFMRYGLTLLDTPWWKYREWTCRSDWCELTTLLSICLWNHCQKEVNIVQFSLLRLENELQFRGKEDQREILTLAKNISNPSTSKHHHYFIKYRVLMFSLVLVSLVL